MLHETQGNSKTQDATLFCAPGDERRRAIALYDSWMKRFRTRGRFADFVTISPALAELLLEHNPNNRTTTSQNLRKITDDMRAGNMQVNGETIIIADTGELNDGQHRLMACVKAGMPFETAIVVGVERQSRETLDQGAKRLTGKQLQMLGYKDHTNLACAARVFYQMKFCGHPSTNPDHQPTTRQCIDTIEETPGLLETKYGHRAYKAKLGSVGLHVALRLWFTTIAGEQAADRFYDTLIVGADLKTKDPIFVLRKALQEKSRITEIERAAYTIKAWSAWRQGRAIKSLRFTPHEDFPVAV